MSEVATGLSGADGANHIGCLLLLPFLNQHKAKFVDLLIVASYRYTSIAGLWFQSNKRVMPHLVQLDQ